MNTNTSIIPNVAVVTFAFVLAVIVAALCIIVVRDGNTQLVSQSMQELVYIAGAAIVALGALLGVSKYFDSQQNSQQSAAQVAQNGAQAAVSAPAVSSVSNSGVGDLAALLAAIQPTAQPQQPATVAPVVTPTSVTAEA